MLTEVKKYQAELEENLCKLIEIPSVYQEPTPEAPYGLPTLEALRFFLQLAESFGFHTEECDGRSGFVHWQGTDEKGYVGSVCHLDVVPAGDWLEAFNPQITEKAIIGRGSVDDKGPALSVLYAMKALKDDGYVPKKSIRLILGLDEERGMTGIKHYNSIHEPPIASFTADADFPVIHAEKGICSFKFVFDFKDYKNTAEKQLVKFHAGSASNVIPGIAYAELKDSQGQLEKLEFKGKMGHASVPEAGLNAISEGAYSLYKITSHPVLDFFNTYIKKETNGQSLGISYTDEDSGSLTLNVGIINLDQEKADFTIDIRYPVTMKYESITKQFAKISSQNPYLTIVPLKHSTPLYREKNDPLVLKLMSAFKKVTNMDIEPLAIGGGTYARAIPNCLAFGPVMPGEEMMCHQKGEYILRETLIQGVLIYKEALRLLSEA